VKKTGANSFDVNIIIALTHSVYIMGYGYKACFNVLTNTIMNLYHWKVILSLYQLKKIMKNSE